MQKNPSVQPCTRVNLCNLLSKWIPMNELELSALPFGVKFCSRKSIHSAFYLLAFHFAEWNYLLGSAGKQRLRWWQSWSWRLVVQIEGNLWRGCHDENEIDDGNDECIGLKISEVVDGPMMTMMIFWKPMIFDVTMNERAITMRTMAMAMTITTTMRVMMMTMTLLLLFLFLLLLLRWWWWGGGGGDTGVYALALVSGFLGHFSLVCLLVFGVVRIFWAGWLLHGWLFSLVFSVLDGIWMIGSGWPADFLLVNPRCVAPSQRRWRLGASNTAVMQKMMMRRRWWRGGGSCDEIAMAWRQVGIMTIVVICFSNGLGSCAGIWWLLFGWTLNLCGLRKFSESRARSFVHLNCWNMEREFSQVEHQMTDKTKAINHTHTTTANKETAKPTVVMAQSWISRPVPDHFLSSHVAKHGPPMWFA